MTEHERVYGKSKFHFTWGCVTHPGIWACGGGRKDLLPVCVGVTVQYPNRQPSQAWWAYVGPVPEFDNDWDSINSGDRSSYIKQASAIPDSSNLTRNM